MGISLTKSKLISLKCPQNPFSLLRLAPHVVVKTLLTKARLLPRSLVKPIHRGDRSTDSIRASGLFSIDCRGRGRTLVMAEKELKRCSGKKRKEVFVYGNYRFYYGYRIGRDSGDDPRLMAFKKGWFEGKDCLDVGCNSGLITMNIAKKFSCRSILGIDIDGGLIDTAYWNLRKAARKEASFVTSMKTARKEALSSTSTKAASSKVPNGRFKDSQDKSQLSSEGLPIENFSIEGADWLDRVSFKKENFVENTDGCKEKYDTILCLSVTKWIHLNWGDEGLLVLFSKIWRLLRQGGILLLEPQPWKSYGKNRRVSETAKENFSNILFTPDHFEEILLDKIGFRSVENITENLPRTVAGFERPIFAFRK